MPANRPRYPETCPHCKGWVYHRSEPCVCQMEKEPGPECFFCNACPCVCSDGIPINCPDCGYVEVKPDVYDNGNPVSGKCPKCDDRLYFA